MTHSDFLIIIIILLSLLAVKVIVMDWLVPLGILQGAAEHPGMTALVTFTPPFVAAVE